MRKYSTQSASNIYLRNQTKLLSEKYSPEYRKGKIRNIRVTIQNPDLDRLLDLAKKHEHPFIQQNVKFNSGNLVNPQSITKSLRSNSYTSQKMRSTLSNKFSSQIYQSEVYASSQMKKKEAQLMRQLKTNKQKRETKRELQQIQFKYQQRNRDREIKLKRKTSESSFILQTHQETIEFVKRSKQQKSRSELKRFKDLYKQTQRNHEFQIFKSKIGKMQQSQILAYHKAFLKNQPKKEIINVSDSEMSFSLKMSGLISQKFKVLPQIKEKSKSKRKNRITKKAPQQKLNLLKEVIKPQTVTSNNIEVNQTTFQKTQIKSKVQKNNQIEKEGKEVVLVHEQIGPKTL